MNKHQANEEKYKRLFSPTILLSLVSSFKIANFKILKHIYSFLRKCDLRAMEGNGQSLQEGRVCKCDTGSGKGVCI